MNLLGQPQAQRAKKVIKKGVRKSSAKSERDVDDEAEEEKLFFGEEKNCKIELGTFIVVDVESLFRQPTGKAANFLNFRQRLESKIEAPSQLPRRQRWNFNTLFFPLNWSHVKSLQFFENCLEKAGLAE